MQDNITTLTNLITTERPKLFMLMNRIIKNRDCAEDALQSLFEKIQRVENSAIILNHKAYLHKLASNLAIDYVRKQKRHNALQESIHTLLWVENLEDDTPTVEQQASDKRTLALIENTIETLPEPMKTIFCLNRFQGLSQTEIARVYGTSIPLVNRYLHRALNILANTRDNE